MAPLCLRHFLLADENVGHCSISVWSELAAQSQLKWLLVLGFRLDMIIMKIEIVTRVSKLRIIREQD